MKNDLDPLVRDLVDWLNKEPRLYTDVLDAWRTSCPRLTVWEDAVDRGETNLACFYDLTRRSECRGLVSQIIPLLFIVQLYLHLNHVNVI